MSGNHDGERKGLLQIFSGAGDSVESGGAGKCQPDSLCGSQAINMKRTKVMNKQKVMKRTSII